MKFAKLIFFSSALIGASFSYTSSLVKDLGSKPKMLSKDDFSSQYDWMEEHDLNKAYSEYRAKFIKDNPVTGSILRQLLFPTDLPSSSAVKAAVPPVSTGSAPALAPSAIYREHLEALQGKDPYPNVRNNYTPPTLPMPSANNSEDLQGSGLFADEDVFGTPELTAEPGLPALDTESAVAPLVADRLSVTDLQNLVRLEAYLIGTDKLDYAGVLNHILATKAMLARPDLSGLAGVDLAANNGDVSGGDDLGGQLLGFTRLPAAAKEALGSDSGSEEEGEDDQEAEQPVDTSKIAALLAAGNLVNIEEVLISDEGYGYEELLIHDLARKRRILQNEIQASSGLAAAGDSGSYLEPNKQIKDIFSLKPVGKFNSGVNPIFIRRPAAAKEAPSGQ